MSLNKRIKGDFNIEQIDSGTKIIMHTAGGVTIDGNLTVTGTQTSVQSTNTTIVDNTIVLNSGETGIGVSEGESGLTIDRGTLPDVGLRYNETTDRWEATDDGTVWYPLDANIAASFDLISDTSPQLGANLDVNGYSISSASNGDIVIVADGTGLVKIDQDLSLKEQATDETPTPGYNKLYAKAVGAGGTGLYFSNLSETDELVSKKKAIVYGIIF